MEIVNKESFYKLMDPGTTDPDRDPHRHRNLIGCSLGHATTLQKFYQNPVITFLGNPAARQTLIDKQTDKQTD